MSNVELNTVFHSVLLATVTDTEFCQLLVTTFPAFTEVLKNPDLRNMDWRVTFGEVIQANRQIYFEWFERFVATDTRFDAKILFYITNNRKNVIDAVAKSNASAQPITTVYPSPPPSPPGGPAQWKSLHKFAAAWNGSKVEAHKFFTQFDTTLTCGTCRNHWRELWKDDPANLSSRSALFEWTVKVHNKINLILGKPEFELEDAKALYDVDIASFFDRIYIINLDRRMDRWKDTLAELAKLDWPFVTPIRFKAIDAAKCPPPASWLAGGGGWGCMQSHRQVLEASLMDGLNRVLVLEDDIIFDLDFITKLKVFISEVPTDWDQLMIGGQLFKDSTEVAISPNVRQVTNCQRTHCYAVQGKYIQALYQKWCSENNHCDITMGPFQADYKVYAPTTFLGGQRSSRSDISGKRSLTTFWTPMPIETLHLLDPELATKKPFVTYYLKDTDPELFKKLIVSRNFHSGLSAITTPDRGLTEIIEHPTATFEQKVSRLQQWINMIEWEGRGMKEDAQCLIWCPGLDPALVEAAKPTTLVVLEGMTAEEILAKYVS